MKVIVTGGSGFIGQRLTAALLARGHQVTVFDHHPPIQGAAFVRVDLMGQELPSELFSDVDAVIHLAGKNIFGHWNEEVKKQIYDSRILSTRGLVSSLANLGRRPEAFISASAVGIYGDRGEEDVDESTTPGGDFLAKVCFDWEKEARAAEDYGVRTVQVRTAPVTGPGGLLAKVTPLYKMGLGGPLGSGRQWFPWVHIQDIVNIYVFVLENRDIRGPVNASSPNLVRNREFSRVLARVLRRPHVFRVPRWAVRLAFGELADVVLASQKVHPSVLTQLGYKFAFPDVRKALENVYR
ncbi:MAG: TIGR01777 family protein [Chloroflexi bacterium]|nr:TIGR01777 family protein [Chloroflexota bacterium]